MPQQLPTIPRVDKKTSYQGVKAALGALREAFLKSYLFDSASVTVVDNPGKGRSAEVNFPTQGGGQETLVINPTDIISNIPGTTEISTAVTWPDGTACAVDIGTQYITMAFCGYRVLSGVLYLRWQSMAASGGPTSLSGADITITAFL
tara:strand:+ start:174 stop:617 length:444 start_codon:yes stop_codon:yes gene_type:complete